MSVYTDLYKAFSATGVPGALQAFPKRDDGTPGPPFFVYLIDHTSTLCADNSTWASTPVVSVELYEAEADFELESRFREIAETFGPAKVEELWVESEHCREVVLTFCYTPPAGGEPTA